MKFIWTFGLLSLLASQLFAQPLSQRLDAFLQEPWLKTSEVGISVWNLTTGQPVYRYQDEKLYRPASVEKVLTSVAALARLGTEYTFDTRLGYTGTVVGDTLRGNLYLIGGFDPEFMEEDLDSLVAAVVHAGIRYVADTLIADVSLMDSLYWGAGWCWDDTPHAFQPYLSPLMLNRGCVEVTVQPTQPDSLPLVVCRPASDYYQVCNRAVSHRPQAGKLQITRNWLHRGNVIEVSGNVERTKTVALNVEPSQDFFLHTLVQRLRQQGIGVAHTAYGEAAAVEAWGQTDSLSLAALSVVQRPIRAVLKQALKESDNLCAEAMFYHLGAQLCGQKHVGGAEGSQAIEDFIEQELGRDPKRYRIADGSGVSVYNYLSPSLLMQVLKYAHARPEIFEPFYASLPIAGVDGTLQHRMKKTTAYRKVRAKTGSVAGVSSLAGYAKAANGDCLAFVIINQNVLKLRDARAFQDRICSLLTR